MIKNAQISKNHPEDEIRLIDILSFLVFNKNLILSITFLFTLSSLIYCFSVAPVYKVSISFLPSQEFHILEPIIKNKLSQIKRPIFREFINQMKSPELLQKIATEGGFIDNFKSDLNHNTETAQLISRINNTITTSWSLWNENFSLMSDTTVEMTGNDPKVISEFLNALSEEAIKTAQNKTIKLIQEVSFHAIKKLEEEIEHLNINTMEEQDVQFNIKLIEQEIEILRKQARAIRLKKIKILENHLKVAGNFPKMEESIQPLDPFDDFAFLNKEKNIRALINTLKTRTNDDLFTPEIIKLQELLEAYKKNKIFHRPSFKTSYKLPLKILKARRAQEKINHDEKIKQIEAIKRSSNKKPEVIRVSKKNFFPQEPNSPAKAKIITFAIAGGLFLGIFIAILKNGLRILKQEKSLGSP